VDMAGAAPAADLLAVASVAAPVRGVRVFGVGGGVRVFGVGGGVGGAAPTWLADGRADAVWEAASSLGITVVATLFTKDLAGLGRVVDRHPEVPVALDHCGFPSPGAPVSPELLALAGRPAVHLKVTTHVLKEAPPVFVRALVDAFGADRLAWGSDHPQTQGVAYPAMVALGRAASARLNPAAREAFLGGTASRLWFGT